MTERKPHSDNALIDQMEDQGGAPSQGGSAGGNVARTVGTRSEARNTAGTTGNESPTGRDNPDEDAIKGEKTIDRLDPAKNGPKAR